MLNDELQTFHNHFRLDRDSLPTAHLDEHGVVQIGNDEKNKTQLRVRAYHFYVLSTKRIVSSSAMLVEPSQVWEDVNQFYYFEKELQELALQCLYLTNTTLGECIVQRNGQREMQVVGLRSITFEQLTIQEKQLLTVEISKWSRNRRQLSFGADLEVMLRNTKTNKYLNGDMLEDHHFGFDEAIAIHKNKVFHPIIEIRPKPAMEMNGLHKNLLTLYHQLMTENERFHLETITEPNPIGRFFLGGHLHFGSIPFSFKHVRLLDQFVAIPFSLVEKKPSFQRRNRYGRLGSVRKNVYEGFEYRVLPTWFQFIPSCLPLLLWVEYLLENASTLIVPPFKPSYLRSYYVENERGATIDQWFFDYREFFQDEIGVKLFHNYNTWLKKL